MTESRVPVISQLAAGVLPIMCFLALEVRLMPSPIVLLATSNHRQRTQYCPCPQDRALLKHGHAEGDLNSHCGLIAVVRQVQALRDHIADTAD